MLQQNGELLSIIQKEVVGGLQTPHANEVRKALGSIVTQLVTSLGNLPIPRSTVAAVTLLCGCRCVA